MPNPFEIETNVSTGRVQRGKNLGFDEAFLDLQMEESEVLEDERESINYRALSVFFMLCLLALGLRVSFLQGVKGYEYRALAEGNKLRVQYVLSPRGLITDRTGKVIASNIPSFELDAVTADLPADPQVFRNLVAEVARIVGKPPEELMENISRMAPNSYQNQPLVLNITKEQALVLISRAGEHPGFVAEDTAIRDYKDPYVFTHLTGYSAKINMQELAERAGLEYPLNDYIGKTGIELQYEEFLHGTAGKKQSEIDAQGNFKKTLAEVPSRSGDTVKLNIDYDLQKVLYESMRQVMDGRGNDKAAAVAVNPQTGEVLALISLPAFDSNMFARGITQKEYDAIINNGSNPLLNRAVAGTYPPGSTVKPMMAIAALSEGIVDTQTKILDDGLIQVGSYSYYGYERGGLGIMDIYSAIARSSDIYFYTVGGGNPKTAVTEGLGPDRIAGYLRKFNLGKTLGIDLPNEKPGLVPDTAWKEAVKKEAWFLGNTYHYAIGQGDLLTTPLQVNSWTATIANGGRVMRPYILNEITNAAGKVLKRGERQVISEGAFNAEYIKVVQDAMRQTVTDGSGRLLAALPVAIAGKTGTAQFISGNLTRTHAWFTSYAPADNPQIVITVLVEDSGGGDKVAVPISKAVYEWWAQNRYNR